MAKKVVKQLKMIVPGGKAVPGQQLGPVLGAAGINIGEFVKRFNAETQDRVGELVPTVVNVFDDRSYQMIYKTEPASQLILKAVKAEKGSGTPNTKKVGKISNANLRAIAEKKAPDLNAHSVDAAVNIIKGTARSMGVEVEK